MVKIGLVLGALLVAGAIAFPQFRPAIIGLAPFALLALCPISMFFAMRGMNPVRSKTPEACADPLADQTSNGVKG